MENKNMPEDKSEGFGSWCILELMGHVKLAGYVTEEEHFGTKMGRIDVPGENGDDVTQFFGGHSVYRLTPCSEEVARAYARNNKPRPVSRWDLALPAPERPDHEPDFEDDEEHRDFGF